MVYQARFISPVHFCEMILCREVYHNILRLNPSGSRRPGFGRPVLYPSTRALTVRLVYVSCPAIWIELNNRPYILVTYSPGWLCVSFTSQQSRIGLGFRFVYVSYASHGGVVYVSSSRLCFFSRFVYVSWRIYAFRLRFALVRLRWTIVSFTCHVAAAG